MTDYPQITFYDISCTVTSEPWSPYTARTYLALRLLGIPFERHMLPMARIHPTLSAAGVTRALAGRHTLPALTVSSGNDKQWVTESDDIAAYLQKLYLENGGSLATSLFPDASAKELVEKVRDFFKSGLYQGDRWKSIVPPVYKILEPESQQFFLETRTESWGKSPKDILATDAVANEERDGGVDKLYAKVLQPFSELYAAKEKGEGVWLGGERAVYPDLMTLELLQWMKCANGDAFERGLKLVGGTLEQAWIAGQTLFKE